MDKDDEQSASLPRAEIAHSMPGRVRIRIDACAGDADFLAQLSAAFAEQAGVRQVRTSVLTGSLVLLYAGELESLLAHLRDTHLVELAPPRERRDSARHSPMLRMLAGLEGTNASMAAKTDGAVSLATLSFLALIGAGLVQVSRGQFLPAGMTIFKYALSLMEREALRERVQTS